MTTSASSGPAVEVDAAVFAAELLRAAETVSGMPAVACVLAPQEGGEWSLAASVVEPADLPPACLVASGPRDILAAQIGEADRRRRLNWVGSAMRTGWCASLAAAGTRVDYVWDVDTVDALLGASSPTPAPRTEPVKAGRELAVTRSRFLRQRDALATMAAELPGLSTLAWVDSGCQALAAEMTALGVPCRRDVLDELLVEHLGGLPGAGDASPPHVAAADADVAARLRGARFDWRHAREVIEALADEGIELRTTSAAALSRIGHPVAEPLIRYRRLAFASDWARNVVVEDGRHVGEWMPLAARSGRGAARNGLLNMPREFLAAYVADPGWTFVAGDFAQVEPRTLAVLSGDTGLLAACAENDVYAVVARALDLADRDAAKVPLNAALYGRTDPLVDLLRRRFPDALRFQDRNEAAGRRGASVRSVLGRRCDPAPDELLRLVAEKPRSGEARSRRMRLAGKYGRYTRNFPVQASASELANTAAVIARCALARDVGCDAAIVMLRHDELVVHCAADRVDAVCAALTAAAAEATRLVFGRLAVSFPLRLRSGATLATLGPASP